MMRAAVMSSTLVLPNLGCAWNNLLGIHRCFHTEECFETQTPS